MILSLACFGCEHAKPPAGPTSSDAARGAPTDGIPRSTTTPKADPEVGLSSQTEQAPELRKPHASSRAMAKEGSEKRQSMQSLDELLLFFPTKYLDGDWQPAALNYSDVSMSAADGTRLHGWYCPAENRRAVVLLAHGNGGNVTHRAGLVRLLQARLRATTLIFDYRGYGHSGGVPTVEGILSDARAARTALAERAHVNESDIVLMGESLGGAVAVQLAAEKPPRGLVLDRTFSSLKDIAAHHYPALAWLVPAKKLNSVAQVSQYEGPLLQCHGVADGTIPFALAVKLFDAANQPKEFIRLPSTDHNDPLPDEFFSRLDAFFGRL
jgi:uncharacterized protein